MSIQKRGKKWAVLIYDPKKGKTNRWIGTFPSKAEAQIAEGKAIEQAQRGKLYGKTIESFAGSWLEQFPRGRESTNMKLAYGIKPFVKKYGGRELGSIGRAEARAWALEHRWNVSAVSAMFTDAMRVDLCEFNPFIGLGFPHSKGRKDLEVPSREEVDALAAKARELHGPIFAAYVCVGAFTGMRPGEIGALRWPCIDFANDEIHVLESWSAHSRTFTKPKNGQTRTIVMPPPAKQALLELPRGDGLIFKTNQGNPLAGSNLRWYWNPVRAACERPEMAFYELRHFAASYMLNHLELAPQDVAQQLGHTDGGVLVQTLYGHPSAKLARERIKRAFVSNVQPLRDSSSAGRSQSGGKGA